MLASIRLMNAPASKDPRLQPQCFRASERLLSGFSMGSAKAIPVFVRAYDTAILSHAEANVRAIMRRGLDRYFDAIGNPEEQVKILAEIATCTLIRICLGIRQVDPLFAKIKNQFYTMG